MNSEPVEVSTLLPLDRLIKILQQPFLVTVIWVRSIHIPGRHKRHCHPFVLATSSGVFFGTRAGCTCPCPSRNVHRDIIPAISLLRQHSPMSGRKVLIKLVDWRVGSPFGSRIIAGMLWHYDMHFGSSSLRHSHLCSIVRTVTQCATQEFSQTVGCSERVF